MNLKTLLTWFVPGKYNHYQPYALRKKALTFYVTILFGFKATVGFLLFAFPQTAYYASLSQEGIAALVNQTRAEVNLDPLTINAKLKESALGKANDMMQKQYFAHVSPEGVEPWYWFDKVGYQYTYAGENLALGFETNEGVHEAWMNSEGHRNNIINPNYREIGVAIIYGNFEGVYTTIIVQHFGSTENTEPQEIPEYPPQETTSPPEEPKTPPKKEEPKPPPSPPPDLTPPAPPEFTAPSNNTLTRESQPTLTGKAEAQAIIFIYEGENKIGQTKANASNTFSFTFAAKLSDGEHSFRAQAQDQAGNQSAFSGTLKITIDTKPPSVNLEKSYIIPSYLAPLDTFDVFAYVTEDPIEVRAVSGKEESILEKREGNFYQGAIKQEGEGVWIRATDRAGNVATEKVNQTKSLNLPQKEQTLPRDNTWASFLDTLNQTTNKLILTFIFAIFLLLLINILVHIRKQSPRMIVQVFLVLILSGFALMF